MLKRDNNRIYLDQLQGILIKLRGMPQRNPLAYEISRATKNVLTMYNNFIEEKESLMNKYLTKDPDGNFIMKDNIKKALEENPKLSPTEFAYAVDKGKEQKYERDMLKLLSSEANLTILSVNAKTKKVRVNNSEVPLKNCLSEHFEIDQINLLEHLGVLTHLD